MAVVVVVVLQVGPSVIMVIGRQYTDRAAVYICTKVFFLI